MTKNRFQQHRVSQRVIDCMALFKGAEMANRIAKTLGRIARADAYRIKTDILLALFTLFPDIMEVYSDPDPYLVSVRIAKTRHRIHARATDFEHIVKRRDAA